MSPPVCETMRLRRGAWLALGVVFAAAVALAVVVHQAVLRSAAKDADAEFDKQFFEIFRLTDFVVNRQRALRWVCRVGSLVARSVGGAPQKTFALTQCVGWGFRWGMVGCCPIPAAPPPCHPMSPITRHRW